ncbi:glycolate oxidase subunit GlcE [Undibacterium sp. CY18W]|uniref:Glycolate oxidase subunit GlcE n=1 Tax=Undibacterium hunanense TaxID=2762292 RepID=A0ABR6ZPM2_9BURK|nr:glycolate oxidase subunit GlcE [Undibacterium hunanense]MBC3917825.1 glycolate oxidase subunit GlcE [Undibacterium hunanense]
MQSIVENFRERILAASNSQTALQIQGGGSKRWYGQELKGELLETSAYQGILAYDPTELVLTARSGTRLQDIEAALAEHNQMLAFEPPHWGTAATIGGVVAAGLSGPRRPAAGAVRDFVLGASLMDGKGDVLEFGGQVMKNVAGYDVSRLLTGSMGCLGLLLDISVKVLPRPFAETTLVFALSEADAITRLNQWAGQALPISGSCWHVGRLMLRLSGAEAAVRAAKVRLGGEEMQDAAEFWISLREQTHDFFSQDEEQGLWRLSLPSTATPLRLSGKSMIEWGGAQRWLYSNEKPELIRLNALAAGGHACLFRGGDKSLGVFAPLSAPLEKIHQRLKTVFDPAGIFNPGRMYKGF